MNYTPLVSIALGTYNGERFLKEQMDSLINQSYSNIEIIISDDNSTDSTLKILNNYITKYDFIKVLHSTTNYGFVKNFEKAISNCSGEYICLCDQDDIWHLSKIHRLINRIGSSNLIYHNSNFVDEGGEVIGSETMATKYSMYSGQSPLPFLLSNCISGHSMMFKRSLLPHILPFDRDFYHDWWIAYVALNFEERVDYIDEVLVSYRQHNHSITDNFKIKEENKTTSGKNRISVNLSWLKKCCEYKDNKNPIIIEKTYNLFKDMSAGKGRLKLFVFLLKHYDFIFYKKRPNKGLISKINYIRKLCFEPNKFVFTSSKN